MRLAVWLVLPLALAAARAAAPDSVSASKESSVKEVAHQDAEQDAHQRAARWVVFRPMFVTKNRQRQLNRIQARRGRQGRITRALHFPAGAGDETGLALRVAVNDLLFQSAPTNDLPEPAARGGSANLAGGSVGGVGGGALRPMLLARLRAASREREPAEEEAFLLMSTGGGRPAIVPAPTSRPQARPQTRPQSPGKNKQAHNKHKRKNTKRRVARDTRAAADVNRPLGQQLDAMANALRERADLVERVKKYDAQGVYPAYSYTHGRYTRATVAANVAATTPAAAPKATKDPKNVPMVAAKPAAPRAVKVQVKVQGDDDEDMDAAETIVFRPLFAHREREALKQKRRRVGLANKKPVTPSKPNKPSKPLRRRQPARPVVRPVRRPMQRRMYQQYQRPWSQYQYSPYRRVVYYH